MSSIKRRSEEEPYHFTMFSSVSGALHAGPWVVLFFDCDPLVNVSLCGLPALLRVAQPKSFARSAIYSAIEAPPKSSLVSTRFRPLK
jgi:hypothetical protein